MPPANRRPKPGRVRKTIRIDQNKLEKVKRYFGATTDAEALDCVMETILSARRASRSPSVHPVR